MKVPPPPDARVPRLGNLEPDLYARRIQYVAALQFQVATIAGVLGCGGVVMFLRMRNGGHRWHLLYILFVMTLGMLSATIWIDETTSPTLHRLIDATVAHEFRDLESLRFGFERATSVTATFLIGVAGLLLFPVPGRGEKRIRELASRNAALSYMLAAGTALLAGDVLLKMCAGQWALAYFVKPQQDVLKQLVDGIVSGWAVYDSLVLASAYIPAAVVLRSRLKHEARKVDLRNPPTWFDPQWLTVTTMQEVSKILAILAPFLIGRADDIAALLR